LQKINSDIELEELISGMTQELKLQCFKIALQLLGVYPKFEMREHSCTILCGKRKQVMGEGTSNSSSLL